MMNPKHLINRFGLKGFSLYRGTLFGAWDKLHHVAQEKGLSWSLKYPVEVEDNSPNSRIAIAYEWCEAKEKKDLGISPLFVVHPKLVTYNTKIGFRLEAGETPCALSAPDDETTKERELGKGYYRETYTEHIDHLLNAYNSGLAAKLSYAASRLEGKLSVPAGAINEAIQLCIALHDVGKLTIGWQEWAHKWQQEIGCPLDKTTWRRTPITTETILRYVKSKEDSLLNAQDMPLKVFGQLHHFSSRYSVENRKIWRKLVFLL